MLFGLIVYIHGSCALWLWYLRACIATYYFFFAVGILLLKTTILFRFLFFFVALAHELVVHLKNCIFLFEIHFSMGHSAYIYIYIAQCERVDMQENVYSCLHTNFILFVFAQMGYFLIGTKFVGPESHMNTPKYASGIRWNLVKMSASCCACFYTIFCFPNFVAM